jgi:ribonuclease J
VRVRIHRGADQVGGSCVEFEADGTRLIVDLGLPLDAQLKETSLPPIPGLLTPDDSLVGVLVSHSHPDHWGLLPQVPHEVPIITGRVTAEVLRAAQFFGLGTDLEPSRYLEDRIPLRLGPFTVTPYQVDHSAHDAYALLIAAGDQRIFYSGDFRGHGPRSELMTRLIADPPEQVDVLLLEGTQIRPGDPVTSIEESEVEDRAAELMASTSGLILVTYSPQNVDRMKTMYRAAKRAERTFVIDLYAEAIAQASTDPDAPTVGATGVQVYVPQSQRVKVKESGEFARVNRVMRHRVYRKHLAANPGRYVLTFRGSMAREIAAAVPLEDAAAIWSMWAGYLDNESGARTRRWFTAHAIPLHCVHASGHAMLTDLQRLAAAIDARTVVPIHTNHPELFAQHFTNVTRHADGEWWDV